VPTSGAADCLPEERVGQGAADLNEAVRLDPTNSQGYGYRGYVFQKRREMDAALADFNTAVRLNPQDDWACIAAACSFGERGDLRTAVGDLDAALDANPNNLAAIKARGHVHMLQREPEKAVIDFERAIQFEPRDPAGYTGRAAVAFMKGDFQKAVDDYSKVSNCCRTTLVRECSAGTLALRSIRVKGARRFRGGAANRSEGGKRAHWPGRIATDEEEMGRRHCGL
jgi:tetratricopeptide (TPR) repeat protein